MAGTVYVYIIISICPFVLLQVSLWMCLDVLLCWLSYYTVSRVERFDAERIIMSKHVTLTRSMLDNMQKMHVPLQYGSVHARDDMGFARAQCVQGVCSLLALCDMKRTGTHPEACLAEAASAIQRFKGPKGTVTTRDIQHFSLPCDGFAYLYVDPTSRVGPHLIVAFPDKKDMRRKGVRTMAAMDEELYGTSQEVNARFLSANRFVLILHVCMDAWLQACTCLSLEMAGEVGEKRTRGLWETFVVIAETVRALCGVYVLFCNLQRDCIVSDVHH